MKAIPREAGRVTYSTKIRKLKTAVFGPVQKAIVIGSVLGDGYLSENWSKTNYRLSISHSQKQTNYLEWKCSILKDFVLSGPRRYEKTKSVSFRTISHRYLTELIRTFYVEGKKIIPENISEFITDPMTIAVWYMDDGNIRRTNGKVYGYYLNTQSFTRSDNQLLAQALNKNFGIRSLILKNKGYYRLYIGVDRKKFADLIGKFILPSMLYKIG